MTSWQFLKKHWVMSLIGLVILLTAAVMIIYAVATGEGDEGFMQGKNGLLKWERNQLPVTCMYHESATTELDHVASATLVLQGYVGEVVLSCQSWDIADPFPEKPANGAILVRVGHPPTDQKTEVFVSSPFDPQHGGTTFVYEKPEGGIYGVIIWVHPDVPEDLKDRVWMHEFGHAFGLDHDRLQSSIMFPTAAGRPKELSDRDIKLLKEAYVQ
jgi:hypothetical protein